MELTTLAVALIVITIAAAVQGSVGFGANIVAIPVLLLLHAPLVPGPVILSMAGLNILMAVRDHRATSLGPVVTVLGGRLVGTAVGVTALAAVSQRGLALLVAVTVLVIVAVTARGLSVSRTPRNLAAAGAVSGFSGSTAGMGGPPLAVLYADAEGPEIRGAMGAMMVVGNVVTLSGLAIGGLFGPEEVRLGLLLAPGALVGFGCSQRLVPFLDRGRTRAGVLTVSAVAAVAVLGRLALP